ncbi:malto-oligosyltrehalose trehalohydrolase [Longimycelium tulufanense]|uniref:Malto-oligosyltrehalose trehalohydrolase n=1 Tax=Longimycelium tulufanense TaxID=907463 RepID=A0A8J3C7H5_9PSEU|nr:malto-oligosyltrehalose trehalohydrolase [Longimycelium tulufanense]GGM49718.1 malto-oligosyltrehalose trehalohydrolase [Longimycelium tulufanense]
MTQLAEGVPAGSGLPRTGTDFTVWAPERSRVRLWLDGAEYKMVRDERGWWRVTVPIAAPGMDYGFLLDDNPQPLPDPRSLWQPDGVHRPSRRYDHDFFRWTDESWAGRSLPGSVVYELHVGTFTDAGTFDAAVSRLDHLRGLGVDFVEVMPVNAFDGPYGWGYDGVLWYAVHEPYGGPDGFKQFVDACHTRGLGVLLDVVYNHLGPSGAHLADYGPYFTGRTIWGPALNVDGPDSDEVRRYVIDNALSWLRDFHVDGLRLDAVHALVDRRAVHLLEELASEVEALSAHLRRPLTLIAESDLNDPRLVTAREAGGYGLHAQWNDDLHHCLHTALTGERQGYYTDFGSLQALADTLREVFFHAATWSSFRGRTHGRPVDTHRLPAHRFLFSAQNHDQVGNRAAGDRLSAVLSPGLLGCAAALLLCSPYTPMLFMGEEWGASTPWQFFASFPDPKLAEKVRRGRRKEFAEHGWGPSEVPDPLAPATLERSRLNWSETGQGWHAELLGTYRALVALRRARPALSDPWLDRLVVDHDESRRWIVLHRNDGRGDRLYVACNLGSVPARVPLPDRADVLLTNGQASVGPGGVELGPETFAVLDPVR